MTLSEKEKVWQDILRKVEVQEVSPYWLLSLIQKPMISSLIIALIVALGAGGTIVAADSARPGDMLFGLDRAVENVRVALAQEENKDNLRIRFATERIREVEDLKKEDDDALLGTVSEIEADVFTNETVVKVKFSGSAKRLFTTTTNTRAEIVKEIAAKFNIPESQVETLLKLETENRASRLEDKTLDSKGDRTVEGAAVAKSFLDNVAAQIRASGNASTTAEIEALVSQLNSQIGEIGRLRVDLRNGETKIRVDDNGNDNKERFEVRTDEGRVRIEVKDGEIKVKTNDSGANSNSNSNSGSGSENSSDDNSGRNSSTNQNSQNNRATVNGLIEAEVNVFTDVTAVKVEINDVKTRFTTNAKTRDEIVTQITQRLPSLTRAQVEAVLNFEIENRASRPQDLN